MDLMPTQRISRRTLAALAGSLFIVLCYWFYPHSHTSGVKKYVDNDWTRYDEIRSLVHFTSQPQDAQEPYLAALVGQPNMIARPLTPHTFGAIGKEDAALWKELTRAIDDTTPLVIFSKTHCPYSKKVKSLFGKYDVEPKPLIIEVDLRDDAAVIKAQLQRLTGRATFPNVLMRSRSLGGSDDMYRLQEQGVLGKLLRNAGLNVRGHVD